MAKQPLVSGSASTAVSPQSQGSISTFREDTVSLADFKRSLLHGQPPVGSAPALAALWWVKKGDWERAHEIVVKADNDADAAWVHAHLHRVEGDLSNAQYWYRQAKKPMAKGTLDDEWEAVVTALLAE